MLISCSDAQQISQAYFCIHMCASYLKCLIEKQLNENIFCELLLKNDICLL